MLKSYKEIEIPQNTTYYVTDYRIIKKDIRHFKFNIDKSSSNNFGGKQIIKDLAESIIKNKSPAFMIPQSVSGVIHGGFVDENVLHYYFVVYQVSANFIKRKKDLTRYDACYWYLQAHSSGKIYDNYYGNVYVLAGNCRFKFDNKGCYTFTEKSNHKMDLCCCPEKKFEIVEQDSKEKAISHNIMGTFGTKIAKKELLQKIKTDFSLEE